VYNGTRRRDMAEIVDPKPVTIQKPDGAKQTITPLAGGLVEEAIKLGGVIRSIDGNPVVHDEVVDNEHPQNKP